MILNNEILAKYVGGQLEVQNKIEKYMFRGEINSATLNGTKVEIGLEWFAKGEGYPPFPTRWVADKRKVYKVDLQIYSVSDIGPGSEGSNRICLQSGITNELTVLFPPNGSKLDRSKVQPE